MAGRTKDKLRELSITDLGIEAPPREQEEGGIGTATTEPALPENDIYLALVRAAMADGYAGAILCGPPGTGKSWYAARIANSLVGGDLSRAYFIQFHPSYQYEDFVEGYVPEGGQFERRLKTFGLLAQDASQDQDRLYVLVIDEISRTDVARVFGEALTYVEMSKRDISFRLASGTELAIPRNIFIVATMNPWDRGVDDLDVALERRFAQIDMPPDRNQLAVMLQAAGLPDEDQDGVLQFFDSVQRSDNIYCRIGHAYFLHARDPASLRRLWDFRLAPFFRRACKPDPGEFRQIESLWGRLILRPGNPEPAVAVEG
jgi:5-methylcytosine-specific restriction protein B